VPNVSHVSCHLGIVAEITTGSVCVLLLQREGVLPTTRHVYPILRTYAAGGSLEYLQERVLLDVATSTDIRVDADCFNCLLRVR
jgi:hypothetical protein